ncbi:host-nuclease inhibitor Gam family protein [Dethiosulfatarculus sandiegensis]|uniref:Host-nuclease inhibitor protein Gam n=1 Tax=Dethiosulfatarculus sandiegensis TaxID=1429043 RepID=A0A0D2J9Z8_9BACT|nr:host-nuclease inhibitor Gam family protein [Dethiosulfatarculus sandiegensis]KIX14969.1 host-nuclease inhibitor protein Gam [Dethiosulfatarculus sandiegensis]
MPRKKPTAVIIQTLDQANDVLAQIGKLMRGVKEVELRMGEEIAAIKTAAQQSAAPAQVRIKELETALATFGQLNKQELFAKPRSRELQFGVIGFRKSTEITTLTKLKLSNVLEKLKEYNFFEAIKKTEKVDKEALRDWPDERLELVGMRRREKDAFFYEIKTEQLKK